METTDTQSAANLITRRNVLAFVLGIAATLLTFLCISTINASASDRASDIAEINYPFWSNGLYAAEINAELDKDWELVLALVDNNKHTTVHNWGAVWSAVDKPAQQTRIAWFLDRDPLIPELHIAAIEYRRNGGGGQRGADNRIIQLTAISDEEPGSFMAFNGEETQDYAESGRIILAEYPSVSNGSAYVLEIVRNR